MREVSFPAARAPSTKAAGKMGGPWINQGTPDFPWRSECACARWPRSNHLWNPPLPFEVGAERLSAAHERIWRIGGEVPEMRDLRERDLAIGTTCGDGTHRARRRWGRRGHGRRVAGDTHTSVTRERWTGASVATSQRGSARDASAPAWRSGVGVMGVVCHVNECCGDREGGFAVHSRRPMRCIENCATLWLGCRTHRASGTKGKFSILKIGENGAIQF